MKYVLKNYIQMDFQTTLRLASLVIHKDDILNEINTN